jgi:hypothetical protein
MTPEIGFEMTYSRNDDICGEGRRRPFPDQTGGAAMRHFLKVLLILALMAAPLAAGAQDIRINPVPPGAKPQWTEVPGAPRVSWAPNLPTDVFRYRGKYYFFWGNFFYQGPRPEGPWKSVVKVPQVFYQVGPTYFKTGKKAGGTPAPPATPGQSVTPPKAEIIDIPLATPRDQTPATPPPTPPSVPELPPKVM